jgi:hypothetical protein
MSILTINIFVRIMLEFSFGDDFTGQTITYEENGQSRQEFIGVGLLKLFQKLLYRQLSPQLVFFPETYAILLNPTDREFVRNARRFREMFTKSIRERREMTKQPGYQEKGDLLDILTTDELFKVEEDAIIDECINFFLAGTPSRSRVTLSESTMLSKLTTITSSPALRNGSSQRSTYPKDLTLSHLTI